MARRKRKKSENGLDSLMDAMTNVVGILVFVLIMTQLGVGDAVDRIRGKARDLPPISIEDYEKLQEEAAALEELLKQARDAQSNLVLPDDLTPESLEEFRKRIAKLKEDLANINLDDSKIKELEEERLKLMKMLAALAEKVKDNQGRRDDMQLEMEKLADVKSIEDIVVRMPMPREAPKGSEAVWICINGDRIYLLKPHKIKLLKSKLMRLPKQAAIPNKMTAGLRLEPLQKALPSLQSEDEDFIYNVQLSIERGDVLLRVRTKPEGGISLDRLRETGTDPQIIAWYKQIKSQRDYIRFHVCTENLQDYLVLREIADKAGVLAGWSHSAFRGERFQTTGIPLAEVSIEPRERKDRRRAKRKAID